MKSATARTRHRIPAELEHVQPTAFLVGVGVDAYEGSAVGDLNFAAVDARLLLRALSDRFRASEFAVDETALVSAHAASDPAQSRPHERPATKANVRAAVERLKLASPDDLVLLSFSGHGYTDPADGEFYVFPYDLGTDSDQITPEFLREKCVSSGELSAWLRDVDAGEIVMVVDSCHAAAAVEGKGDFKPGPMGSRGLGQMAYDKGMRILTASQAGDVAIESGRIRQGLLTYALVRDGLEQGRAAVDGRVTLGGWLSYAERRVPTLFREVLAGRVRGGEPASTRAVLSSTAADYQREFEKRQPDPLTHGGSSAVQTPRLFQYARDKAGMTLSETVDP